MTSDNGAGGLTQRLHYVRQQVAQACRGAGRSIDDVTMVVVSKKHPVSSIAELYNLGECDFGESMHQEARDKAAWCRAEGMTGLCWHFVGRLQSNKAAKVAEYAKVIHSVDSEVVIDRMDRALVANGRSLSAFVQVSLDGDPTRGGVELNEALRLADHMAQSTQVSLLGLMAVPPVGSDPQRAYAQLQTWSERLVRLHPQATAISAGMSQDFTQAIAAGATHLRLGTVVLGSRPLVG